MPFLYSCRTGEQPTALPMLDSGLLTHMVSVALMMSISAVFTWMQWPRMVFGAQNAVVLEPLHRAAAVVLEGVVHVVHALGHVDVVAHPAVVGRHHPVKGLVGDGEQGVAAEHGLEHVGGILLAVVDEVLVLLNGLEGLLLPVPVG